MSTVKSTRARSCSFSSQRDQRRIRYQRV